MLDWDDVRYFLAIAETGSLGAAARNLGVERTTVSRRLSALESALGATLFARTPAGLVVTKAGQDILSSAEAMRRAAGAIERLGSGDDMRAEGTVRLTCSEGMSGFLVRRLGELRAAHPALVVEVLATNRALDLTRLEAELAVRIGRPAQPDLVARKIADFGWSIYAAAPYVEARGVPRDGLSGHDVVAYDASMPVPCAGFLEEHGAGANVVLRANSLLSALNACIAGMGVAALPCALGSAEPSLSRIGGVIASREGWLVAHPDAARTARVRAVMDWIVGVTAREASLLSGAG